MPPSEGRRASVQLREQHDAEWDRALSHPLIEQTAAGTIDAERFGRWVVLNTQFLRTYRRFLIAMGTLAPDSRGSRVMFDNIRSLDLDLAEAMRFADEHRLDLDELPTANTMDYTSYCMASLGGGWRRGLTVSYGVESLFFDAWHRAREIADPAGAYRRFVDTWGGEEQQRILVVLADLVDAIGPSAESEQVFSSVLRLELTSWDEAWGTTDEIR